MLFESRQLRCPLYLDDISVIRIQITAPTLTISDEASVQVKMQSTCTTGNKPSSTRSLATWKVRCTDSQSFRKSREECPSLSKCSLTLKMNPRCCGSWTKSCRDSLHRSALCSVKGFQAAPPCSSLPPNKRCTSKTKGKFSQ